MKITKKIVVVMAIFLSLVLFACGKKTSKENTTNKPTTDKIPTTTNKTTIDPNRKYSLNIKTNIDGCTVLTDKDEYSIGDTVTLTGIGNDQYDCVGFVALNSKSMDYSDVKYVYSYSDTFTFNLGDQGINAISLDLLDYTYAIFAPKNQVCVMSFKNTDAIIDLVITSWTNIDSTIEIGQHIYTEGKAIDYVYDYYPVWKYNEDITPIYIHSNYTFDNNETRLYVFDIVTKDATTYNLSIAPDKLDNGVVSYSTTSNISYNDITGNVRGIIEKDTEVTLYAVGKTRPFVGWYEYGTDNLVSNQSPYIFNMTSDVILTAKWDVEENNIAYLPKHFTYYNNETITGVNIANVKEIIIPSGVTCIENGAFEGLTSLEKITFNGNITICGGEIFTGCTNITDVYYDGTIKQYCSIEYSNGNGNPMCNGGNFYLLDSNGTTTYRNKKYTLVTDLILSDDITSIGYCCFRSFNGLNSIAIPTSVNTIGFAAFSGCDNLSKVYYEGTIEQWDLIDIDDFSYIDGATIYYYSEEYKAGNYWHYVNYVPTIWEGSATTTYTLTTVNDNTDAGRITTYTNEEFEENASVRIIANSYSGYKFNGWYNGTTKVSASSNYTFNINSNLTLTAKWDEATSEKWLVTTINDNMDAGTITNLTNEEYDDISSVWLEATDNSGYAFDGWYMLDGYCLSRLPRYDLIVDGNYTIIAKWIIVPSGKVSLTTLQYYTYEGTITNYTNKIFNANSSVTLTATPKSGYIFDGWYNGETKVSSDTEYTFTITTNLTLLARFMVEPTNKYLLTTINSYPNAGSIPNYNNQQFDKNASVTLTAINNDGYVFDGWYNGETKVDSGMSYTFTIASNLTLTAKWKIYISAFANTPIGGTYPDFEDNEYDPNESLTLTATTNPETGYTFDGWYEWSYSDECLGRVSENETYTFNVTKPAIYEARWVAYTVTTRPCYNSGNDVPDSTSYYYIAGDFTTLDEEKVTAGQTVKLVAVPKEESVTWVGWYKRTGNHTDGYTYTLLSNEVSYDYTMTKESVTIVAKFLLYKVIATDSSNNPTIIEYGYYPQSLVSDEALNTELASYIGDLPTEDDKKTWTSYGYYDDAAVSNYMWYKDIDVDSDGFMDYRGVYFTKYRPTSTSGTAYSSGSGETNSNIYQNGYRKETVYWFKYEPIIWDVVDDAGAGDKRIVSRYVLDGQNWYINTADRPDGLDVIYPSNYEYSTIRTWLNNDFYYKAFDLYRQNNNVLNATDNSITSTGSTNTNNYLCNDTVDKAYLLSRAEHKAYLDGKTYEKGLPTDYAKIQGLNVGDSGSSTGYVHYWLRTPANSETSVFNASTSGGYSSNPIREVKGIRPAIDMML